VAVSNGKQEEHEKELRCCQQGEVGVQVGQRRAVLKSTIADSTANVLLLAWEVPCLPLQTPSGMPVCAQCGAC
jgi:hypothetical protein